MKDRRSETSRANLGNHIPEALAPEGTTVIAVRIPHTLAVKLDATKGNQTRSEYVRRLIAEELLVEESEVTP